MWEGSELEWKMVRSYPKTVSLLRSYPKTVSLLRSYPKTVSLLLHLFLPDPAFSLQPAHLTILPSNRQEVRPCHPNSWKRNMLAYYASILDRRLWHNVISFILLVFLYQVRLGSNLVLTCMGHANTLELVRDLEWRLVSWDIEPYSLNLHHLNVAREPFWLIFWLKSDNTIKCHKQPHKEIYRGPQGHSLPDDEHTLTHTSFKEPH